MFNKKKNGFLESKNLIMCPQCGTLIPSGSKNCPNCDVEFESTLTYDDERSMKLLSLNEAIRKRTKYWRELILIFSAIKLPIEVIAYFELDSIIGKAQGIGDLIFAVMLFLVSLWMVIIKNIRKKRGEFVE